MDIRTATVTLLFTDVEGSTRLLRQLGGRYGEVLSEHEHVLREAFAAHGGEEIDTQGDSFFVAFASAGEAIRAAVAAQRTFNGYAWPDGVAVRVRMGVHTGRASVQEKRYLGVAVHRAARICAAGHGGQVLASETVRNLVEDEEDELPGIEFADLGEQRLKDFDRPVRVYQIVAEGLEREFPQLRTAERTAESGTTPHATTEVVAPAESRWRRRFSPRVMAIAGAVVLVGAVPLVWILAGRGGASQPALTSAPPNSVAVIDPSRNELLSALPVGTRPTHVAAAASGVWVTNADDQTVSRIDPATQKVTRTIPVGGTDPAIAAGRDVAWVATNVNHSGGRVQLTLSRIDTQFYGLTRTAAILLKGTSKLGGRPVITFGGRAIWCASVSSVARFDRSGAPSPGRADLGVIVTDLATDADGVWATGGSGGGGGVGVLARINPGATSATETAPIGDVGSVVVGFGAVWVASGSRDSVTRLDPETLTPIATIRLPLGSFPTDIAVGEGAVWVVNRLAATVSRIDPAKNEVVDTIHVGGHPEGIAAGQRHVWVTVE
jgi:YVTN family beta-propeller protein